MQKKIEKYKVNKKQEIKMVLNQLKLLLKKDSTIDKISRIVFTPIFLYKYQYSNREAKKRANGKEDAKYLWIKKYKNIHKGKRCFIVATGPSLTIEDLNLIKGEISLSMNSAILAINQTEWRPKYFFCQDEYVYKKIKKDLENECGQEIEHIWVGDVIAHKYGLPKSFEVFPLHYLDHKMYHKLGYGEIKFSEDCYACIYDAYTVTFTAMQMAYYMGFKEIYLLGCDCNYNQKRSHFIEYGHKDPKASIMGDKMIYAHTEFKKFADKHNIKVVNCTRGGMLEVYPRERLENVMHI